MSSTNTCQLIWRNYSSIAGGYFLWHVLNCSDFPRGRNGRWVIIFWNTLKEMMDHPLTDQWNKTFLDEWEAMHADGKLVGVPVAG